MDKTVLLVDDDNLVLKTLGDSLTQSGFKVSVAPNGKQGLEAAIATHPDIVLADIRMPEMDGLTMLERLRADEWGKQVPVIMLTTDESTGSINQAMQSGVTVYISKSGSTPDEITAAVKTALGL
jgi:CheY-like chemotaxis protein